MVVTVTNVSGGNLNNLDTISFGSGPSALNAVGGQKKNALPYPFNRENVGTLANSASAVLPMRPDDWWFKPVPGVPSTPMQEWNMLVQAGKVTMSFATESTASLRDVEEIFFHTV